MKKVLILLVFVIFLINCKGLDLLPSTIVLTSDSYYTSQLADMELFYIDADIFSLEELGYFMQSNLEYKSDGDEDVWSTPEETLTRGYGDCEDLTLVFINLAYIHLNLKFDLVLIDLDNRQLIEGGSPNHAEPYLNSQLYNYWTGEIVDNVDIAYLYSFDQIFVDSYYHK